MKRLPFMRVGLSDLSRELNKPFSDIFLSVDRHSRINFACLCREDGSCIKISSKMHDVADRAEVGVLEFRADEAPDPFSVRKYRMRLEFLRMSRVEKLVIVESDIEAESGIALYPASGSPLIVLSAVFPFTLAVKGVPAFDPGWFKPEYPLTKYRCEIV